MAVASTAAAFARPDGPDRDATWCRRRAILVAANTASASTELASARADGMDAIAL